MTTKLLVANLNDIDVKGSRRIQVKDIEIAVFRLTDGSVLAVENKCPHKGGLLSEGMVCGTAVHCPLHDWKVDLRSGRVHEPDDGCVTTFETEIDQESGSIYVTI
ncbi:nitrite reductase small subunit NirD [Paenibacillus sp. PL91]|jgi:nitrite reductase (NADH) small subunit|uniref:nitrite reductase small subunit NirD n=1 Tax=Paenibacillus sp. PL91 TaxID=2729538 RepID=UPI00145DC8F7|nr:nitrite reductase small subunit NirD [Paenibacillus sp. PL91]MBC9202116.1 nitrite reductase small subunit NirD [Paenibacillus sp. PL91]